jgi:glycosyltransferase involved in cell wall biosynthesis
MGALYEPGRIPLKMKYFATGYSRRFKELLKAGAYDGAFVYRAAGFFGGAAIARVLAARLNYVFDFDDAIHLRPPVSLNDRAALLKSPEKTATICRMARHVTVGNEFLAAFARESARAVTVIPTTIDTESYRVEPRQATKLPVVGWTGSGTTVSYLEAILPSLVRLRREVPFELQIVGAAVGVPEIETTCRPWREATEVEDIRRFDVGLMPLADDDWCRGKCGLKALQYMALGIPPIVSPVGANAEIVTDGVDGFWARDDDEWIDRTLRLLRDPELRTRMGAAARLTVERRFSARVQAPRLARILIQSVTAAATGCS